MSAKRPRIDPLYTFPGPVIAAHAMYGKRGLPAADAISILEMCEQHIYDAYTAAEACGEQFFNMCCINPGGEVASCSAQCPVQFPHDIVDSHRQMLQESVEAIYVLKAAEYNHVRAKKMLEAAEKHATEQRMCFDAVWRVYGGFQ